MAGAAGRRPAVRARARGRWQELARGTRLRLGGPRHRVALRAGRRPGARGADVARAARICNDLPINNVKLHNLHVLKNTPLAEMFFKNEFTPIEFDEYCGLVGTFLDHLSPEIYLHRLVALSSRWEELIAPEWTRFKMRNYQKVIDYLNENNIYQGRALVAPPEFKSGTTYGSVDRHY